MGIIDEKIWEKSSVLRKGNMIFVTVGMNNLGFERLITEMDGIAPLINEEIIMQIGNTSYLPKNTEYFRYTSKSEMDSLYENARIVVSHGGAGSIINLLRKNKLAIIVPRQEKFGEIFDNQQNELAEELSKEKRILAVYDVKDLYRNILNHITDNIPENFGKNEYLINILKEYISSLEISRA
jgi:beta-1,4-N-acetylglucosaminyltransferase